VTARVPKSALVGGWGAVEWQATAWSPTATVEEIEPRLWLVTDGIPIGMIGKAPWTVEEVERRAVLACQGRSKINL